MIYISQSEKQLKSFNIYIKHPLNEEINEFNFIKNNLNGYYNAKNKTFRVSINQLVFEELHTYSSKYSDLIHIQKSFFNKYNKYIKRAAYLKEQRKKELKFISKLQDKIKHKQSIDIDYKTDKYELYTHQKALMYLGISVNKCAFFGDMGTGKTAAAIHTFRYRWLKGEVKKGLVIVPNSLKFKWAEGTNNELEKHTNDITGMVLHGNKQKRIKIIKEFIKSKHQILVMSYSQWVLRTKDIDTMESIKLLVSNIDMVILDESHKIKSITTKTTKNIHKYLSNVKYLILMTGTPTPHSLLDIYSQYYMIDPAIFGVSYYTFLNTYFKKVFYDWKLKKGSKDTIINKMKSKALIFKTDDCVDLPDKIVETIYIETSKEYLQEVDKLIKRGIDDAFDISIYHNLLTSCNGFIYKDKKPIELSHNPKEEALVELLSNIISQKDKAIVWYSWRYSVVMLEDICKKYKINYISITSNDKSDDRLKKIQEFEKSNIPVLLTSPELTSEGFDIYSAKYSIYYNLSFKFDKMNQSEYRNRRLGSDKYHKEIIYYYLIMKDSVEESILNALHDRLSYKEALFGIYNYIKKISTK